ncbi:MAG: putative NRPS-like protein biosynthetic cluster [Caeruleum heppii]|nr:MAG: putative NRPS-like protein biosynthetic cluster [Caeruleum heppii]
MAVLSAFVRPSISLEPGSAHRDRERRGSPDNDDDKPIKTLLELVAFNAIHNPKHLFCLQELKTAARLRSITFEQLARAVDSCAIHLSRLLALDESSSVVEADGKLPAPVGLFMGSDIGIFINLLALMKLAVPFALFSARLSPAAIAHLIEQTRTGSLLVTSQTKRAADSAMSLLEARQYPALGCSEAIALEACLHWSDEDSSSPAQARYRRSLEVVDEQKCGTVILHSSGSTGLPKPIYHCRKYLMVYATCHLYPRNAVVAGTCVSTLPLFHGFGLLAPLLSLSIGKPCSLPALSTIPTASSTMKLIEKAGATCLMTVPSILEDLLKYQGGSALHALRELAFVACGGGPMKISVAEALSAQGVRLLNHCGTTELGGLAPIFDPTPEYDWRYFRLRRDLDIRVESVKDSSDTVKIVGRPFGWEHDFIVQDFLQPNPRAPSSEYRFLGRADELIVMANGEKVRPALLEETVAEDPHVRAAIAFGTSRDQLGMLIEAAPGLDLDTADKSGVSAFIDAIWPSVQQGNEVVERHGKVSKSMIIVTSASSRPLHRTAKGSLARKEILEAFATEIDATYENSKMDYGGAPPSFMDLEATTSYVRNVVHYVLDILPDDDMVRDDDDFFEMGMDSRQATMLRQILSSSRTIRDEAEDPATMLVSPDFVHAHPSINLITQALMQQSRLPCSEKDSNTSRGATMLGLLGKYSSIIDSLAKSSLTIRDRVLLPPNERIVLLTGSTGSLGSSILHSLVRDPSVSQVLCLNRKAPVMSANKGRDMRMRQVKANEKTGLTLSANAWRNIRLMEAIFDRPRFGLEVDEYNALKSATHIIHNAWPMDFHRSLGSFETHIQALCSIIDLALHSTITCTPRILFTSSIAVVARYPDEVGKAAVPEHMMSERPGVTAPFGYAEAKWVCEQLIHRAMSVHPHTLEASIVRVGQLSGSTVAGSWNSAEHIPAMCKSSQTLRALPDIHGTLSWIPVDVAGQTMKEILLQSVEPLAPAYHLENPRRQQWHTIVLNLKAALEHEHRREIAVVPWETWLELVRTGPDPDRNPALKVERFLKEEFRALASGEVVLDTTGAQRVAPSLASAPEISPNLITKYVAFWRATGFL